MENPLTKIPHTEKPVEKYPIMVKCVVSSLSETIPDILKMKEFIQKMNIHFTTREYNSKKFSDDRVQITRLPAFHIYVNNLYRNTVYMNTRPYESIQKIVKEYEEVQAKIRAKRKTHTFYTELLDYIKGSFRKKRGIDIYKEGLIV